MARVSAVSYVTFVLVFLVITSILSLSLGPQAEAGDRKASDCLKRFLEVNIDDCPISVLLFLFDIIPPEITAPPDIKVVSDEAPVFLDIGKPKVTDNADPLPTVTNDAPKGHMFPFGTTVVKWLATDHSVNGGNTGIAYQFVTVVRNPSPVLPFKPETCTGDRMASLKLDPIPASVPGGGQVLITGRLVDANTGEGVQGVDVMILDNKVLDKRMLGMAITDGEGKFSFTWYASPSERGKDRHMSIIAKFGGISCYSGTVSSERSLKVEVERLTLDLFAKKQNFGSGDRAIVFVAFRTFGDKLIDPDQLQATFDGKEVSMIKKATGIYEFMSLPGAKSVHLFVVKAEKLPGDDLPFGSVTKSVLIR